MRPMRSFGGRGGGGGFGLPGLESMSSKLAVGLVAGSVMYLLLRAQGSFLLLMPSGVFGHLFIWQPLTYAFIESEPLSIIFGAMLLWSIGGWLEGYWGAKRLLMVAVGCTALAGYLLGLAALFIPMPYAYQGGWVMCSVLWVAYGLTIGKGQTNFWGIPLSGNAFAAIGAGFVLLRVLTAGFAGQLPHIVAMVLVLAYVRGASPKRLLLYFQHWRLQRQLRDRSKHLHVVPKDRPDRDQYLN
ncbi:DUF1751 domain-containing protein [Myxococcus landrumensis]|uniref:DUF1751 domain-containing protein n=1 Tax=Myxococcus landrumensis TaxID=2813577 RepID=A0ABX7N4T5_9BACT|nr:DUF1751 domain-containing protein [Myxococcus landrumus]QSQ13404.1 DUF1751 domain-containing protein [Myxococcus landrumus]